MFNQNPLKFEEKILTLYIHKARSQKQPNETDQIGSNNNSMKINSIFKIMAIFTIAIIISCSNNKSNKFTSEQQIMLNKMNIEYKYSSSYNDSLTNCKNNTDSMKINYFDKCYHANDSLFNQNHQKMTEMISECNLPMCCTDQIDEIVNNMDELRNRHVTVHPRK